MPVTPEDVDYFVQLQTMSDEELSQAWHAAVSVYDEQRIALIESTVVERFGIPNWQQRYAARLPDQTYYQLPSKP